MALSGDARGLILPCPRCGQRNRLAYGQLHRPAACGKCQTRLAAPSAAQAAAAIERSPWEAVT